MKLIYNAIQTPDGTVLVSRHRHDCVIHKDVITGETYMVDGGLDYRRGIVNDIPAKDLSIYLEDGHDIVRQALAWGTYGKNGDQPLTYVPLVDMETDHIKKCLDIREIHPHIRIAFKNELKYRKGNPIQKL